MTDTVLKRILVFLLLIFLILPFYVSSAFLLYEKFQMKSQMKERVLRGIDRDELTLIVLNPEIYESVVSYGKEIDYLGDVYDMVWVQKMGTQYHCWCWLDKEESDLNDRLTVLVDQAMGENGEDEEGMNLLNDYFDFLYCYDEYTLQLPTTCNLESEKFHYLFNYSFSYSFIFVIPPEILELANMPV